MIKIENEDIYGWEAAFRGMRNPKNSWDRSDSGTDENGIFYAGENDLELAQKLADAGPVHGKFLRMITVTCDITAPRYWWIEWDTYKIGTVSNSCSTMHKITERDLTLDDFSHEHLDGYGVKLLESVIYEINRARSFYANYAEYTVKYGKCDETRKDYWWQMIQLLPQSFNQRRTVQMNYAVLRNMYEYRKDHKLDEWQMFCKRIEELPYSELITGKRKYESNAESAHEGQN